MRQGTGAGNARTQDGRIDASAQPGRAAARGGSRATARQGDLVARRGRRAGGARRTRALVGVLGVVLATVAGAVGLTGGTPAGAVEQPTLVRGTPTATTPHVTDGNVRTVAEVGGSVVLGGDFTQSTDPDRTVADRSYLLAFDKATGRIRRDWVPVLDGEVYSVVAAPDGQSVYVGGRFNTVNGATRLKVARISMADGSLLPFQHGFNAVVTTMALQGGRLFVGGVFTDVQGRARRVVALNAATGAIDDTMAVPFEGKHRGGDGKIWRIEASPDGQHVVVVGSFTTVGGQPRGQIAKLDVGATVTLSPWSTTAFSGNCANFTDYVRDVSYSPDSSYFVVVTTGAKGSGINGTCDSVSRWEDTTQSGAGHSWIEYSGGDSYYSAEVTGSAVYVGGHFRWSNNSHGTDSLGPGGIGTQGIAALDPVNGLPLLSWNPGRNRGRAVWQLVSTPDGLWVASDTDRIAGGLYRGRIAFFPLAGGAAVPQPARPTLPALLEQHVPGSGGAPARVVRRSFDGTTVGAPETVVGDAGALAGITAAFWADGTLYSAHTDGTLRARAANGTSLGPASNVDLRRMTAFADDLRTMRSALYDQGRLYYTLSGSSTLFMRYLSVEGPVVGAQRFDVASSSGSVQYSNVTGMVRFGDVVYFPDLATGALRKGTWRPAGGIDPATVTTVSPANAGGISWVTSELWARPAAPPANQPPVARVTSSCTGLRCTFDASTSTDADGTITGVTWSFSDGGTATGTTATRTFAASGTHTATATVTDDDGATGTATRSVTVTGIAPTARFAPSCSGATCTFNAGPSSDADGEVVAWSWDFGDGATGTGRTARRTYTASGTYSVRLVVTDDQGLTANIRKSVTVEVPASAATFAGVSSVARGTARTHVVPVPATAQPGDQLLLFVSTNAPGTAALTPAGGWTRVLDPATTGSRHAVFARVAGTTDPGRNITVTIDVPAKADLVLVAYRGLRVAPGAAFAPGYVTPTATAAAGDWVVSYWADKSATTTGWTTPAGTTRRHAFAGSGAGRVAEVLVDSGGAVGAGPVGGLTAASDSPVANAIAATVVLRPA